jgi:hypothetical protein
MAKQKATQHLAALSGFLQETVKIDILFYWQIYVHT